MVSLSESTKLWNQVLDLIKEKIDDRNIFDNFFQDTYIYDIQDTTIILVVKGELAVTLLTTKYKKIIQECITEVSESSYDLNIVTSDNLPKIIKENKTAPVKIESFFKNATLNDSQTFDSFVKGDSNREACQAAIMAASNPGMFNPLFIYSGSGLGKTHLLHAIGNYIKELKPNSKIVCVTADDFINEYMKIVTGQKNLTDFIEFCASCDALLLDDIQFMKTTEKCQECFYLIFNKLDKLGKQIVITSDRHPKDLNGIQDRLVTRFEKGLTVTINEPDKETALAILKKKIEAPNLSQLTWDDLALSFIAEKFNKTVRDLEGALNKVVFQTILRNDTHITIELVADAISSIKGVGSIQDEITEQKIINIVSDYYSLTPALLTGTSHTKQIVLARHVAMYLIKYELGTPFKKIGQAFGGKDHSTVISGVSNVEKMLKTNIGMQEAIKTLKAKIKNK